MEKAGDVAAAAVVIHVAVVAAAAAFVTLPASHSHAYNKQGLYVVYAHIGLCLGEVLRARSGLGEAVVLLL